MFKWLEAKKLKEARDGVQVQVNDVYADVRMSKYLPENVKAEFNDILRLQELIPDVSLEALAEAREKLNNLKKAIKVPGMEGAVSGYYSDIFCLICDGMDYTNVDAVFNIANLEARLARVATRQERLIRAIAARGGIQNATPSQRSEWNRLEQMKVRFGKLLEVAMHAQDSAAVRAYLNDLATQIKFYDPSFKLKTVTEKTSIEDLKKIYVEYQAALRKIEQERITISQIGMEDVNANSGWINPPQIEVTKTTGQTTTAVPTFNAVNVGNTANTVFTPTANATVNNVGNQADDIKLRDIKAAANQIIERLKLCDQNLTAIDQKRNEQDKVMKDLLEQYKNAENSPAELERLKGQIHSLQKQRVALQRSRAMWENVKTQTDNVNSLLVQLREAKSVEDLQRLDTLGIGSIENIAMLLKSSIESMNQNLRDIEIASNMANDIEIDTGMSEEIPMLDNQHQGSGVIDALMKEFRL